MVLKLINGFVIAEGEFGELAAYTGLLFDIMRQVTENRDKDKAKKEADMFSELMNMTFEELMKRENNNNEEEDHD